MSDGVLLMLLRGSNRPSNVSSWFDSVGRKQADLATHSQIICISG